MNNERRKRYAALIIASVCFSLPYGPWIGLGVMFGGLALIP